MKILYDVPMSFRNTCLYFCLVWILSVFPSASWAQEARLLTIIDGDSLRVEYQGRSHEVRLIGIDTPEWRQEYSVEAKAYALNFCYDKSMRLEFDTEKKDRYGRELAYVYCDDQMLNENLVRVGLALAVGVRPNTRYYSYFKRLEKQARKDRRGFWLHGGLKQTPAQWRKTHKR